MEVVLAPERDLEEIVRLNSVIFRAMKEPGPYTLEQYDLRLIGRDYFALKALKEGRIVGSSIGYSNGPGTFHLWVLGVQDEHRAEGIGTMLLRKTESRVLSRGYKQITTKVPNVAPEMQWLLLRNDYQIAEVSKEGDINARSVEFVKSLMI